MTRIVAVGAAVQQIFLQTGDSHAVANRPSDRQYGFQFSPSEVTDVKNLHYGTGGGGLNAAVTFSRQGLDTALLATIGPDGAGQAVLQTLDQENIDAQYVHVSHRSVTACTVFLLAEQRRTALSYRGALSHPFYADFSLADTSADWVYVASVNGDMQLLDSLFRQARDAHVKVCFNPGSRELQQPERLKSLLEDVSVLVVNKDEARQIAEGLSLEEVARHLLHYVPVAVVTDGENGSVVTDSDKLVQAGIYEDAIVADRTGAGDAFGAGFLSQYVQGKSLGESIQFASANATSVLRIVGTKRGLLVRGAQIHNMPIKERKW